ncbi:hypothetical protein NC653_005134 [Populus alba x Populus x berolinensis]|uniref:Uncharacterized protein n=1 Tax=Populus alba x Populus x berolinensis TaxID=444605 RepID=A0AAD6WAV2_9ROSI|nr:hypothetical protein NC653_005134 [Populus alba x Populus x berolinensis]
MDQGPVTTKVLWQKKLSIHSLDATGDCGKVGRGIPFLAHNFSWEKMLSFFSLEYEISNPNLGLLPLILTRLSPLPSVWLLGEEKEVWGGGLRV